MIALKNVLVATDFGDASNAALAYGREFARTFGATLHVLHVVDDIASRMSGAEFTTVDIGRLQLDLEESARQGMTETLTDPDTGAVGATTILRVSSNPAATIVAFATEADIDCIVIGTHGRGALAHLFVGSVAERVVRTAPCPVLTVRHPEREFIVPDPVVR